MAAIADFSQAIELGPASAALYQSRALARIRKAVRGRHRRFRPGDT